jgi:hypothetical protein
MIPICNCPMIVSKCRSVLDGFNLRSFQNALTIPVCNCPMIVSKCRSFLQVSNELREPAISTALAKRIAGALPKVKVMNAEFEYIYICGKVPSVLVH